MSNLRTALLWLCCICALPSFTVAFGDELAGSATDAPQDPQKLNFFEQKIRPVLVQHCYSCHSAEAREIRGGLLLDSREGLRIGGDSGPALVAGQPEASELIRALKHESVEMPPDQKLADSVIQDFEAWIRDGAVDPRSGGTVVVRQKTDIEAGRRFWSFQPLQQMSVPVEGDGWAGNEVDRFIAAKHRQSGITAPPADAGADVILKRLHIVLTGLLPTPEQQENFAQKYSQTPDAAVAEVVDSLLNSPRFGERWGRHWLDAVRFAESTGGGRSMMLPDAWRFRDYVIRSFQQDKPYSQLIREHLAGDLLPASSDEQHDDQVIGAGYLMLGAINYEEQDKEQLRMDVVDEQIDSMGRTFLGMTLGCARCHDHKFDPVPAEDYYALAGIFRSTRSLTPGNVCGWVTKPLRQGIDHAASSAWTARDRELEQQISELRKQAVASAVPAVSEVPGIFVDDDQAMLEGEWTSSMFQPPFRGIGYRHSGQPRKGLTATYPVEIPADGEYAVRMLINHGSSRSEQVPVVIFHADGETELKVNQQLKPASEDGFMELGRFRFEAGMSAKVVVNASAASPGHVIIDAMHWVPATQLSSPDRRVAQGLTGSPPAVVDSKRPAPQAVPSAQIKKLEELRKEHAKKKPAQPVAMCVEDEQEVADCPVHVRGEIRNHGSVVPRGFLQVATQREMPQQVSEHGRKASGRLELADWVASTDNPLTARVWVNRLWQHVMGVGLVRTPDNFGETGQRPTHPELLNYLAWTLIHTDQWSTKAMLRRLCNSRTFRMASVPANDLGESDPENVLWTHAFQRRLEAECIRDCLLQTSGRLDLSVAGGAQIARLSTYDNEYRHADFPMQCRSVFVPAFRNTMLDLFEIFDGANPNSVTGLRTQSNRPAQALFMMNSPFVLQQATSAAEHHLKQDAIRGMSPEQQVQFAVQTVLCRRAIDQELRLLTTVVSPDPLSAEHWAAVYHALYSSIDFRYIN